MGTVAANETPKKETAMWQKILDAIGDRYGPYAFGLIALLVIWFLIVRPELEANRIEFDKQAELVDQMRHTSDAIKSSAHALERVATRLEKLENK